MNSRIRTQLNELAKAVEVFPWHDKEAYAAFMAQTFYYTRHTTRILARAASEFSIEDEKIHQRFLKHCQEEMKHEVLAERDVVATKASKTVYPEMAATRAFYQCHYHTIQVNGPWSIFGYIIALEGLAAEKGPFIFESIQKAHGPKAGQFMKVHATEDIEHMDEALKQIEGLSADQVEKIVTHMETTCFLYASILRQCAALATTTKGVASNKAAVAA